MKSLNGDLIKLAKNGMFDVIVHGCNCFNNMGAGIARDIKTHYKDAWKIDQLTIYGSTNKLGTITYTEPINGVIVVNAYIQYRFGYGGPHCDYNAIRECMKVIKKTIQWKENWYSFDWLWSCWWRLEHG